MNIPITVTQQHIKNGVPMVSGCPIALAILDAFTALNAGKKSSILIFRLVLIGTEEAMLMSYPDVPNTSVTAKLTPRMQDFVKNFDLGLLVKPFKFTMHLSDKVLTRLLPQEAIAALKARYGD